MKTLPILQPFASSPLHKYGGCHRVQKVNAGRRPSGPLETVGVRFSVCKPVEANDTACKVLGGISSAMEVLDGISRATGVLDNISCIMDMLEGSASKAGVIEGNICVTEVL